MSRGDPSRCATHPDRPAELRCDGCGAGLCPECVDEGHRLLFCRRCGERALPLDPEAPATTTERRRAVELATAAAYSYREALLYPLRGYGAYAYWAYIGLQTFGVVVGALPVVGGLLTLAVLLFLFIVGFLLPAFLFAITRSTGRGENELPDWPDFDPWELVKELFRFLLVAAVSLVPMAAMLRGFRCETAELVTGQADPLGCGLGLVFGYFLGVALWLPAFGAVAIFRSTWLVFRLDLHFRAARADYGEYFLAVGLTGGLLAVSGAAPFVLASLPLPRVLVSLVSNAVAVYALFVGAHLAGVYFRRHSAAVQAIYGD